MENIELVKISVKCFANFHVNQCHGVFLHALHDKIKSFNTDPRETFLHCYCYPLCYSMSKAAIAPNLIKCLFFKWRYVTNEQQKLLLAFKILKIYSLFVNIFSKRPSARNRKNTPIVRFSSS